mgnify:CR=1 FL=1
MVYVYIIVYVYSIIYVAILTYVAMCCLVTRSCGVSTQTVGCSEVKAFGGSATSCYCESDQCNGVGSVAASVLVLAGAVISVSLLRN